MMLWMMIYVVFYSSSLLYCSYTYSLCQIEERNSVRMNMSMLNEVYVCDIFLLTVKKEEKNLGSKRNVMI